jgi:hypothetical protein
VGIGDEFNPLILKPISFLAKAAVHRQSPHLSRPESTTSPSKMLASRDSRRSFAAVPLGSIFLLQSESDSD